MNNNESTNIKEIKLNFSISYIIYHLHHKNCLEDYLYNPKNKCDNDTINLILDNIINDRVLPASFCTSQVKDSNEVFTFHDDGRYIMNCIIYLYENIDKYLENDIDKRKFYEYKPNIIWIGSELQNRYLNNYYTIIENLIKLKDPYFNREDKDE